MMARATPYKAIQFERDRSVSSWQGCCELTFQRLSGPAKDQGDVVGRHLGDFDQRKIVGCRQFLHHFDVAYAPFGISPAKARIKGFIALRRVLTLTLEGTVE